MLTKLIPAPQQVLVFDDTHFFPEEALADLTLFLKEESFRLEKTVAAVFPSLTAEKRGNSIYAVATSGMEPDISDLDFDPRHYDGYFLDVSDSGLAVESVTERGLFYGLKALEKLLRLYGGKIPCCRIRDWADTAARCEYLEFRNFHPPFEQLAAYVRQMADMHINELILEWEDKRPFPTLPFLQDTEHGFTQRQIDELEQTAFENYLNLIPLQQSFGHLEYVLRHSRYRPLRELDEAPADLNPLNPASAKLSAALLSDVMAEFPRSEYIHMGCDEVFTLGRGKDSIASGMSVPQLFIQFVNQAVETVCRQGKIPLIWHDMIINASAEELKKLDKRVIVVVWMYDGNDLEYRASAVIKKLADAGVKAWGGCAVRCWDSSGLQNYPLLANRKNNILRWNNVAVQYALEGMVNTNWSAYSALAAPYGIYETSRYPACFAASVLWNRSEAEENSFLFRYLYLYHGVDASQTLREGWRFEDYYAVLPRLLPSLTCDEAFGNLMAQIMAYEKVAVDNSPVYLQMFRVLRHGERQEEWESFRQRYLCTLGGLKKIREPLLKALQTFLSIEQAADYIFSRYCLWEMLEREILRLAEANGRSGEFPPQLTGDSGKTQTNAF